MNGEYSAIPEINRENHEITAAHVLLHLELLGQLIPSFMLVSRHLSGLTGYPLVIRKPGSESFE